MFAGQLDSRHQSMLPSWVRPLPKEMVRSHARRIVGRRVVLAYTSRVSNTTVHRWEPYLCEKGVLMMMRGLSLHILERMKGMGLLQDVRESLEPKNLASRPKDAGICNCAALFATERPRFTAGLIRDLEEMVHTGAPGWNTTALGTIFGEKGVHENNQPATEIVPLNEEQRQAFQTAISSPLTVVTGPPGTGKSQIVVSMIADSYLHNRRVLFTSKNNKAVDVVEDRVASWAANPLMIRTGRRFFGGLAQRLVSMLALRPSDDDRLDQDGRPSGQVDTLN